MDGQTIRQSSVSNRYGTTKVFESQNLTDKQIHNYAQQLAGDTPLKEVRPGIYTAKLDNGTSLTLRNLSSSQEQTGARWTIDIRGNQQLAEIAHKYGRQIEIKRSPRPCPDSLFVFVCIVAIQHMPRSPGTIATRITYSTLFP